MSIPGSWKGIVNRLNDSPKHVREYFPYLPGLLKDYPLDVSISYLFGMVELAQNKSLYCGMVKLHSVDKDLARKAVDLHPIFRSDFRQFYETIFGKKPNETTFGKLKDAEAVRDLIVHGKHASESNKRRAIVCIIEFAEGFNEDVNKIAGFQPFGDLRGFKGRGQPLDKSTSRWILKGMGFKL
ncbi:MAG: hypothetical protein OXF97_09220 [Nitrospira sp.]|nr:hypothetical protein [Nitrospira sp.]MCY3955286.1 hypothetical protein [Nitrospira sp.]